MPLAWTDVAYVDTLIGQMHMPKHMHLVIISAERLSIFLAKGVHSQKAAVQESCSTDTVIVSTARLVSPPLFCVIPPSFQAKRSAVTPADLTPVAQSDSEH